MRPLNDHRAEAYLIDFAGTQFDRCSLREQQTQIAAFAATHDLHIKKWSCDGFDSAAQRVGDDALRQLIERVSHRQVDTVLLFEPGMIAELLPVALHDLEVAVKAVRADRIIVAREFEEEGPDGLMHQIIASFDGYERALRGARRVKARSDILQRGAFPGGRVPFGYRYVKSTSGLAGWSLDIDEKQAQAVRRVFELVARDGYSLVMIAQDLNDEGYRTTEGKPFTSIQIHRIIKRKALYQGEEPLPQRVTAHTEGTATKVPAIL